MGDPVIRRTIGVGLTLMLCLTAFGWWKLGTVFGLILLVMVAAHCALWALMLRSFRG